MPLSPEKMRAFEEFVWRAMGRLDGSRWRDLLDPHSELGRIARAYYAGLAAGELPHYMMIFLYRAPDESILPATMQS
ncbi:MAG: hypothetical protein AB7S67_10290 [Thiomonas sp.]